MNIANKIINNMENIIIGKQDVIQKIVIALLAKGHVLIEDVPGVGKTQCALALAKSIDAKYNRIQFTPDVMASDITGFNMYNPKVNDFKYVNGAVFCNVLLGDEINRASARTQSSLLEAMEEKQVTVDGITRKLPDMFMVLATENPIESKGTNSLPEAQMDRFIFRLKLGYPTIEQERSILNRFSKVNPLLDLKPVACLEDVLSMQKEVECINVSEKIKDFILSIVFYTRSSINVELGGSPRASLYMYKASKARAYLEGRDYVIPEDVIFIATDILEHRLIISQSANIKGKTEKDVIKEAISYAIKNNSRVLD